MGADSCVDVNSAFVRRERINTDYRGWILQVLCLQSSGERPLPLFLRDYPRRSASSLHKFYTNTRTVPLAHP